MREGKQDQDLRSSKIYEYEYTKEGLAHVTCYRCGLAWPSQAPVWPRSTQTSVRLRFGVLAASTQAARRGQERHAIRRCGLKVLRLLGSKEARDQGPEEHC